MIQYKKLTKAQARKLFNAGKEIYLHTNKMSWNNCWHNPMPIVFDKETEQSNLELIECYKKNNFNTDTLKITQFNNIINNYSYYNCDNERGNVVIYLQSTNKINV